MAVATGPGAGGVLIAGHGVAGSALACILLGRGVSAVLAAAPSAHPRRMLPVIEALPESAVHLLHEADLAGALRAAGAVATEGFENGYVDGAVNRHEGAWVHVDRARLARECLEEARRRGARLVNVSDVAATTRRDALASVDATGRAAAWSRPVSRSGSAAATLYVGPGRPTARPGRIVGTDDGWAYVIGHPDGTTVGVVADTREGRRLRPSTMAKLGVDDSTPFERAGTRAASVQWCYEPARPSRLAVGDAALAYSPLAGMGVRFAIASAFAAAATLTSWRDGDVDSATEYYRSFVRGARDRHLAHVAQIDGEVEATAGNARSPAAGRLRFGCEVADLPLQHGGRIVRGPGFVLPDGGLVRWVGGFDLLRLRELVGNGREYTDVHDDLVHAGLPEEMAGALLAWALRVGLLTIDVAAVAT